MGPSLFRCLERIGNNRNYPAFAAGSQTGGWIPWTEAQMV
jgi:hypothetical protein